MDATKDYYAILGIAPSAEAAVVRAVYRALAQMYHPDRSSDVEPSRMYEINEAYEVLSDAEKRLEYDRLRGSGTQSASEVFAEARSQSTKPIDPLDEDWSVAVGVFPDLIDLHSSLSRNSWRLAFAFRAYLLDTKQFHKRGGIALDFENNFLRTYFGENKKIAGFAKLLIDNNQREPTKALNKAVRVMGSSIDAEMVIQKICIDHRLHDLLQSARIKTENLRRAQAIRENPRTHLLDKIQLLKELSGSFERKPGLFSLACSARLEGIDYQFADKELFGAWIDNFVVPKVLSK